MRKVSAFDEAARSAEHRCQSVYAANRRRIRAGCYLHACTANFAPVPLRKRSFSKLLTLDAQRLLGALGADTRIYHPEGLPLPDGHPENHPKVQELRELAAWSEGMVWTSPERHGAMTGIMKAQIDWIPLSIGAV